MVRKTKKKRVAHARADPYGYATTGEEPKQGLQVNPYAIFMQFLAFTRSYPQF
jgi:hypothetical protein